MKNSFFQKALSVFLMCATMWFAINPPVIVVHQQKLTGQEHWMNEDSPVQGNADEAADYVNNAIDEKVLNSINPLEDFLHAQLSCNLFITIKSLSYQSRNATNYVAFHGEKLVPPPNITV